MRSLQKTILFPFCGTMVGGSYVSSSLLAGHMLKTNTLKPVIVLPRSGENTETFTSHNLQPLYCNLSEKLVSKLRYGNVRSSLPDKISSHYVVYKSAINLIKEVKPDITHINDDKTMLNWGLASYKLGVPVVWHIRQERGNKWLDAIRLKISSHIIFVAEANRIRFTKFKNLPSSTTIYNCVDLDKYYPSTERCKDKLAVGINADMLTIGFVGNLVTRKRPEWAIRAAIDIIKSGRCVQMIIVGSDLGNGVYFKSLEDLINQEGLSNQIVLLGYRKDIPELMRAMDLLVLTSIPGGEAFPRAVIEAMASGVPVVSTNIAGVAEAIDNGHSGVLADPDDYSDFLSKLIYLVDNEVARDLLATNARYTAINKFTQEYVCNETYRVYNKILNIL